MKAKDLKISAIVLSGGRSLRLGFDKVLENVGGRTLLEQVVSNVASLSSDVIIVTIEEQVLPHHLEGYPNLRLVTDIYPGKGPLGGIYTGLHSSRYHRNIVVAADMPFLNRALLSYMAELASDNDLVVPRMGNLLEPLHAIYTKDCLVPIKRMLDDGELGVHNLFSRVRVRYVDEDEIKRFDPEQLSFFNINTQSDLKMAKELARRSISNDTEYDKR